MKVYLVEKLIGKKMEPIAIKTNWELAWYFVNGKDDVGMITEMIVDEVYPTGIGVCRHWHFDPKELDSEGNRLDDSNEARERFVRGHEVNKS